MNKLKGHKWYVCLSMRTVHWLVLKYFFQILFTNQHDSGSYKSFKQIFVKFLYGPLNGFPWPPWPPIYRIIWNCPKERTASFTETENICLFETAAVCWDEQYIEFLINNMNFSLSYFGKKNFLSANFVVLEEKCFF